MAIDLSALRKKLNQITGVSSKKNISWRPEEGQDYQVRLLSFPNNEGQPFKELMFYYNIGNNAGLLAPYQFNKPDPIQELINKLRDDGSKESYELAKKLYPKMRCYAPVVVRGEEDKGVRIWSFGKTLYQNLLNIMLDEDYGDITDVTEGRDLKVSCAKLPGKQFADTTVSPRPKQSALADKPEQIKKYLDNVPDVNDLFELKSYAELEKILNDWLNGDEAEKSDGTVKGGGVTATAALDEEEIVVKPKPTVTPKAPAAEAKSSKYANLDDAFADLE
jgi:hypothetical protein